MSISKEDFELMEKIGKRATEILKTSGIRPTGMNSILGTVMDLSVVHANHPLRLKDMLEAGDPDLIHDITGIRANLNRKTGKLSNFFVSRFIKRTDGGEG